MVPSDDGTFGSESPNGSFTGMLGMVQRGEVEVAASDFYTTEGRARAFDFTVPILSAT